MAWNGAHEVMALYESGEGTALWSSHYYLMADEGLGDSTDISQAPDDASAHVVSMISRAEGAVTAESWQAMPWEEHLRLMESMA